MANDAIAAIATPPGRGGIGVVRVSGEQLVGMLRGLVDKDIPPRRAVLADFRDAGGAFIDQGLALYFPAPHSYTGEDVIELQAHGGPAVMQLLLRRCLELGARLAEPGEFTKRAFLNDKLDLAQAESVADLIDASTAVAARCAARSLQGDFSRRIRAMVETLIGLRMLVEATLDFPEDDTPYLEEAKLGAQLDGVCAELAQILARSRQGTLLRTGIHVVIAGEPNVGKSSLLNRLAGDDVAIVSEIPGTTRDAIRQHISIRGVPVNVIDTAGLRESSDPIENIGISRAWDQISKADVVLWVSDLTCGDTDRMDESVLAQIDQRVRRLRVRNKADLLDTRAIAAADAGIVVSAKTGQGIDALQNAILVAGGWTASEAEDTFFARERHVEALDRAARHLSRAQTVAAAPELLAEELRLAQRELDAITGEFTSDDLLGRIFSSFCIGK